MSKLCKDCEYIKPNGKKAQCAHPRAIIECLVTGDVMYYTCKGERTNCSDSFCRPEGKGFVKKEIQGSYDGEV